MSRPPLPPFTAETAAQKARMAEDAWNSRDPARCAQAYTPDSRWRNRAEFIEGREAIEAFPGTIFYVTHDRDLAEAANRILAYPDPGKLLDYTGNMDEYLAWYDTQHAAAKQLH